MAPAFCTAWIKFGRLNGVGRCIISPLGVRSLRHCACSIQVTDKNDHSSHLRRRAALPAVEQSAGFESNLTQLARYLKSEDKPDGRIDCVAVEVSVSQSIINLREHEPSVSLKLRRKPPIDGE